MPFHVPPQPNPNTPPQPPGGLLTPPVSPAIPAGVAAAPSAQPFGFPGGMERMNELYGILAANAQDPASVGQGYVAAVQRQQGLDRARDPMEQMLRLYGNVNPYDFTAESLQKFEENRRKTGRLDFGLLRRVEDMSTTEQKILNDYITNANKAEADLGRMADLSDRFDQMARQGIAKGRLAGGLNEWLKGVLGTEDEVSRLKTEFRQLKNKVIIAGLPPGVASDKDIEIAMGTWPQDNADPAYIAAFLRGMQKLRAIELAQATHAAGYLSRNRKQEGMLEDWKKNRDWMVRDTLSKFGGVYAPTNPDGTPMTAEQAAKARYGGNIYSTADVGPPQAGVTIPQSGILDTLQRKFGGTKEDPLGLF